MIDLTPPFALLSLLITPPLISSAKFSICSNKSSSLQIIYYRPYRFLCFTKLHIFEYTQFSLVVSCSSTIKCSYKSNSPLFISVMTLSNVFISHKRLSITSKSHFPGYISNFTKFTICFKKFRITITL